MQADDIALILPDLRFARSYLEARSEGYADSSLRRYWI